MPKFGTLRDTSTYNNNGHMHATIQQVLPKSRPNETQHLFTNYTPRLLLQTTWTNAATNNSYATNGIQSLPFICKPNGDAHMET